MTLIFRRLICHCVQHESVFFSLFFSLPFCISRCRENNSKIWVAAFESGNTEQADKHISPLIKTWQALLVQFIGTFINTLFACSCCCCCEPCSRRRRRRRSGDRNEDIALCLNLQPGFGFISPTKVFAHERASSVGPALAECVRIKKHRPPKTINYSLSSRRKTCHRRGLACGHRAFLPSL